MQRFLVARVGRLLSWIQRKEKDASQEQGSAVTEAIEDKTPFSVGWLFFGSILLGILVKLVFSHFVTLGYDDYHAAKARHTESLVALQEKTLKEGGSLAFVSQHASGPLCRDSE